MLSILFHGDVHCLTASEVACVVEEQVEGVHEGPLVDVGTHGERRRLESDRHLPVRYELPRHLLNQGNQVVGFVRGDGLPEEELQILQSSQRPVDPFGQELLVALSNPLERRFHRLFEESGDPAQSLLESLAPLRIHRSPRGGDRAAKILQQPRLHRLCLGKPSVGQTPHQPLQRGLVQVRDLLHRFLSTSTESPTDPDSDDTDENGDDQGYAHGRNRLGREWSVEGRPGTGSCPKRLRVAIRVAQSGVSIV